MLGTISSATVWTGNVSITKAHQTSEGASIDQCKQTASLSSAFVYKHTNNENYTGVYGVELGDGTTNRSVIVIQFETSDSSFDMHMLSTSNESVTVNNYDPNTGFFSLRMVIVTNFPTGSGSKSQTMEISGIFIRAPGDSGGAQIVFSVVSFDAFFSGPNATGTLRRVDYEDFEGYGKRFTGQGFTRSVHYRPKGSSGDRDDVFMGMTYPPLKGNNANQYLEVLDVDGARLCAVSFVKRYHLFQYLTMVDASSEQFQSKPYSAIACNTFDTGIRVVDGMVYTVRIRDMGADGAIDVAISGGDDTTLLSIPVTARVHPSFFTEKPNANRFVLNGSAAHYTMKGGMADVAIDVFGFFDVNEAMRFEWANLADANFHQVQIQSIDRNGQQLRIDTTAPTATAIIPAGTLNTKNVNQIRLRAIKTDVGNGAVAFSDSKWLLVSPGIRGLFNVELGGALAPTHNSFQLYMMAGMGDGTTATLTDCTNLSPNWTCNGGSIDYTTNTVSLSMTDNTGSLGTLTLDMKFTDSANATVIRSSSASITLVPSQTHVRVTNP